MVQVDKYGRVTGAALVDLTNPLAPSFGTPDRGAAIDITKNIALLGTGTYTLADGEEGQLLYLAATTSEQGENPANIIIAHARDGKFDDHLQSNYTYYPFAGTSGFTHVAIFTNGAWSV
jgi:hypothetical protein